MGVAVPYLNPGETSRNRGNNDQGRRTLTPGADWLRRERTLEPGRVREDKTRRVNPGTAQVLHKMAAFRSESIWMRLMFMLMVSSYVLYLFAYGMSGWGTVRRAFVICPSNGGACSSDWVIPVEVCHVIAYVSCTVAITLLIILLYFHEITNHRCVLVLFLTCSLVAGLLVIVGEALFLRYITMYVVSDCVTFTSALLMMTSALLAIVELVRSDKVSPIPTQRKINTRC